MVQRYLTVASFATILAVAACGGGGGGSSSPPTGGGGGNTATATPAPSNTTPASMPSTATIGGQSVYVGTNNGHTLYHTTGDGNDVSNCTTANGCTTFWFPYTAPAGTVAPSGTNFSVFQRTDGTYQWAVSGHPLYEFYADTAAGQNNGNGFVDAYGTWSEALATAATSSPAPTSSPSGYVRR
jgi:predicted lipoprotein with Yx(FWY)xxD motif